MIPLTGLPSSGTLQDVPLIALLRDIQKNRRNGILTVQAWETERSVHFHQGTIVWAASNDINHRLGEISLKMGKINLKQYEIAAELSVKSQKKKGAILLEQGFIQPKDLFDLLVVQVKEIVLSLFNGNNGRYLFRETSRPAEDLIGISIEPHEVIREGIYRVTDWTQLVKTLSPIDAILEKNPHGADVALCSAEEKEVLALVDNARSAQEILMLASKRTLAWAQILNLLIGIGLVTRRAIVRSPEETPRASAKEGVRTSSPLSSEPPRTVKSTTTKTPPPIEQKEETPDQQIKKINAVYKKIGSQNYYEMLGVSQKATPDEIKNAYTKLAKKYHPDRYTHTAFSGIMKQTEQIFIKVRDAYETLSIEAKRSEYDAQLYKKSVNDQPRNATQHLTSLVHRAEAAASANDLKMAIYFYEEALRQMGEGLQKAQIYFRYGQILSQVPGRLHAACDALEKSAALDSANAKPYIELGTIFSRAGLAKKAIHALQEALKRDPQNKTAQAELTRLTKKGKI